MCAFGFSVKRYRIQIVNIPAVQTDAQVFPTVLVMSSGSSSVFGSLEWEEVFTTNRLTVDDRILNLKQTPVSGFLQISDLHKRDVLSVRGYNDSEAAAIVTALQSMKETYPALKRQRVEAHCPAPSQVGDPNQWRATNQVACATLNHRYFSTAARQRHGLPVTLQVREFGVFEDILSCKSRDHYEFTSMALELMMAMSTVYDYESGRTNAFGDILRKYKFPVAPLNSQPSFQTDLTWKEGETVVGNYEVKNELGMGGKSPNLQQCGYAIKLNAGKQTRSPLLLTTLVGPDYFQVFGSAWNGEFLCVDPLMAPISLLHVPHRRNDIEKVARVLHAMFVTAKKLGELGTEASSTSTSTPYFDWNSQLRYSTVVGKKTNVWNATDTRSPESSAVIVKFVKEYGLEVHNSLASAGMAPSVRYTEELPGGWTAIVMDKVEGKRLCDQPLCEGDKGSFFEFKGKILDHLKKKSFVHGDLRAQNIICSQQSFFVVDFDWAGRINTAKYPIDINLCLTCWPEDVKPGALIIHQHDEHQLNLICEALN